MIVDAFRQQDGQIVGQTADSEGGVAVASTLEFALFAPHVESVALVGSWLQEPAPMTRDETGSWRLALAVPDGTHEYRFRLPSLSPFMLGEVVDVTDPFARQIDESNADAGVIVVRGGANVTTEYTWQHDAVPLPQDHELVLYELHVAEFAAKDGRLGTFVGVTERLDYLRDLGINALELMPVGAFPMDTSWGYNVRHACAVENAYGTPQDLKRLIDACHSRGMRVILDLVLNHTESESPLSKIDFYYWFRDSRDGEQSFGPKLDYERRDDTLSVMPARQYGLAVARYWLQEYHIDGYRLDATAVLNNFDFVRELRDACKGAAGGKPFYVVAEQLPEDPSIATPEGPTDGAWHLRFREAILEALISNGERLEALAAAVQPRNHGYVSPSRVVNYVESHDEFTLMQRLGEAGILEAAAFRKVKLAAGLLFTAVGNPMLYQGEEFGGYRTRDLEIRPLQWELLTADYGLHLKEHHAWLAATRHGSPALKGDELELLTSQDGTLVYRRGSGEAELIVAANVRDVDRTLAVPLPAGAWRELTSAADLQSDGEIRDPFAASSLKIYARR
jgi:1,4-alpha-glucan branching enzyme